MGYYIFDNHEVSREEYAAAKAAMKAPAREAKLRESALKSARGITSPVDWTVPPKGYSMEDAYSPEYVADVRKAEAEREASWNARKAEAAERAERERDRQKHLDQVAQNRRERERHLALEYSRARKVARGNGGDLDFSDFKKAYDKEHPNPDPYWSAI